jgi:hypothetical protein
MTFTAIAALGIASIIFLSIVLALKQWANAMVNYLHPPVQPVLSVGLPTRNGNEQRALRVARAMAEKRAWELAMDLARREARRRAEDR